MIKYFKVKNADLEDLNKELEQEIKSFVHFLHLLAEDLEFEFELICEEDFGIGWRFSVIDEIEVIKVEIPDDNFSIYGSNFFSKYLEQISEEGISESAFTGLSGDGHRVGRNWKYNELTGIELMVVKKNYE
jgi:hypothetical protein